MDVFSGTSGFSYPEWKGSFYPSDLPERRMLAYYAQHLRSVEINNTFYRLPKPELLEKWVSQVPAGFTFVLKAPRRISHERRLKDTDDVVRALFEAADRMGDHLGPVLVQLPPFMRADLDRLARFLESLPEGRRVAFEFRHPSWMEDRTFDLLRTHGAALCLADGEEGDGDSAAANEAPGTRSFPSIVPTADFGYLRLRRADYTAEEIAWWANHLLAQPFSRAFVFFKHEDGATGPRLAKLLHAAVESASAAPVLSRTGEPV